MLDNATGQRLEPAAEPVNRLRGGASGFRRVLSPRRRRRALDRELERLEAAYTAARRERVMVEAERVATRTVETGPGPRPGPIARADYVVETARRREWLLAMALQAGRLESLGTASRSFAA